MEDGKQAKGNNTNGEVPLGWQAKTCTLYPSAAWQLTILHKGENCYLFVLIYDAFYLCEWMIEDYFYCMIVMVLAWAVGVIYPLYATLLALINKHNTKLWGMYWSVVACIWAVPLPSKQLLIQGRLWVQILLIGLYLWLYLEMFEGALLIANLSHKLVTSSQIGVTMFNSM